MDTSMPHQAMHGGTTTAARHVGEDGWIVLVFGPHTAASRLYPAARWRPASRDQVLHRRYPRLTGWTGR
jgi:hypothetical protein